MINHGNSRRPAPHLDRSVYRADVGGEGQWLARGRGKLGNDSGSLLYLAQAHTPPITGDGSPLELPSNFTLI
jgi:hypothetical protein